MRLTLILLLGFLPYLIACDEADSKTDEPSTPEIKVKTKVEIENPIEQIKESLATIKKTKQTILDKQSEFSSKKTEFEKLITEIKQELLQETDAHRINNRLKNISEYDAYLQEIERRLVIMNPVPDKLLSYERSFEAKLKMVSIMDKAQLTDLKNQLTLIQKNLGNSLEELVIDESQIQRKSIDEIREELQREKYQKKKDERIAKEKQQKLKENKRIKEEKDAQALIEQQQKLKENKRIKEEKDTQALIEQQQKLKEKQDIIDAENNKALIDQQIEQEFCDSIFIRVEQLTELTTQGARCINSNYKLNALKLNNIINFNDNSSPYSIKERLGSSFVKIFYFNGFANLSDENVRHLPNITHHPIELHLDGLKSISRYAAQFLYKQYVKKYGGNNQVDAEHPILSLMGLETIFAEEGVYLAKIPKLRVSKSIRKKLKQLKGEDTSKRKRSATVASALEDLM